MKTEQEFSVTAQVQAEAESAARMIQVPNAWAVPDKSESEIDKILEERGKRYGPFRGHAGITQLLKDCIRAQYGWTKLSQSQKEALEMIAHKIGRILNGDPNYDDSWTDIAGYAQLIVDQLNNKNT